MEYFILRHPLTNIVRLFIHFAWALTISCCYKLSLDVNKHEDISYPLNLIALTKVFWKLWFNYGITHSMSLSQIIWILYTAEGLVNVDSYSEKKIICRPPNLWLKGTILTNNGQYRTLKGQFWLKKDTFWHKTDSFDSERTVFYSKRTIFIVDIEKSSIDRYYF